MRITPEHAMKWLANNLFAAPSSLELLAAVGAPSWHARFINEMCVRSAANASWIAIAASVPA
jgi:hypothetical protein